jgi:hypothetical protein
VGDEKVQIDLTQRRREKKRGAEKGKGKELTQRRKDAKTQEENEREKRKTRESKRIMGAVVGRKEEGGCMDGWKRH